MQMILPAVGDSGVDCPDATLLAGALRNRQGRFQRAVKLLGLDVLQGFIRKTGELPQSQVDAQALCGYRVGFHRHLDGHVDVPAAPGIFRKRARAQFIVREAVAVPQVEDVQAVPNAAAFVGNGAGLERNPPQRPPCAAGHAPTQPGLFELLAPRHERFIDGLHRLGMKAQPFLGGACRVLVKIIGREKLAGALGMLVRQFVVEVPHHVHFARETDKHLGVPVLDAATQGTNGGHFRHTVIMYSTRLKSSPIRVSRQTVPYIPALNGGVLRHIG